MLIIRCAAEAPSISAANEVERRSAAVVPEVLAYWHKGQLVLSSLSVGGLVIE